MGTRGFTGFVVDGELKIRYNQFDSYPSGVGMTVLNWLHETDLIEARLLAGQLVVVGHDTEMTAAQRERLAHYTNDRVGSDGDDWYRALRDTQGRPDLILEAGYILDASDFPADSLFCEWGWLVDFDAQTFEAYEGFQDAPHNEGRFARMKSTNVGYYPVRLVASWPLGDLPDERAFLDALEPEEDQT